MTTFGPSGNSESFYNEGYKHTYQSMQWLSVRGLDAYEYAGGKGVKIGLEACEEIRTEAEKYHIGISFHAPYYINLANEDPEKLEKSFGYIFDSLRVLKAMGGNRLVMHCGSYMGQSPAGTQKRIGEQMERIVRRMQEEGYEDFLLCPETLGKLGQFGTVEEIISLCRISEQLIPCIDFGHVYARSLGRVNSQEQFSHILQQITNGLGEERMQKIHIHFSHIEYTKAGEKMHRTFQDTQWGPDFPSLARALIQKKCQPVIICESKGTMAEDAIQMKENYYSLLS